MSERFNDSFPSKKCRNKTRSKYRNGTQQSARRQRLLCRMLRGYSDWDQEDLVAEMQNHPHCDGHTPPTPDEQTRIKKG